MARNDVGLEASLFEKLAEADAQRPHTFTKWPPRTGGVFAVLHSLPLPFRTHWGGARDVFCFGAANGCERCRNLQGFKEHCVWAIWDFNRKQHGALDLNDKGARKLLECDYHCESRAGCCYTLKKENGVENGLISIAHTGMSIRVEEYGLPCDIVALVCKTYSIIVTDLEADFVAAVSFTRKAPAPPVLERESSARR